MSTYFQRHPYVQAWGPQVLYTAGMSLSMDAGSHMQYLYHGFPHPQLSGHQPIMSPLPSRTGHVDLLDQRDGVQTHNKTSKEWLSGRSWTPTDTTPRWKDITAKFVLSQRQQRREWWEHIHVAHRRLRDWAIQSVSSDSIAGFPSAILPSRHRSVAFVEGLLRDVSFCRSNFKHGRVRFGDSNGL